MSVELLACPYTTCRRPILFNQEAVSIEFDACNHVVWVDVNYTTYISADNPRPDVLLPNPGFRNDDADWPHLAYNVFLEDIIAERERINLHGALGPGLTDRANPTTGPFSIHEFSVDAPFPDEPSWMDSMSGHVICTDNLRSFLRWLHNELTRQETLPADATLEELFRLFGIGEGRARRRQRSRRRRPEGRHLERPTRARERLDENAC